MVDGLVNVIASVNHHPPPVINSLRSPSPTFSGIDSSSDSDDGVSLSQYLNKKTKPSVQVAPATVVRDFKPNYVKPTITCSAAPPPVSNKTVVAPKRIRESPAVVVAEPPLTNKRVRTPSSKLTSAHEESMGMSFLFDSFTLEQKAQPVGTKKVVGKTAQKVVQKPPIKPVANLKAIPNKAAPIKAAPTRLAPVAKRVEDSQMTQLSAESYSYQSGDDEDDGSTTSCFTFTDESYMTEPLFYR
eukprot:gene24034-30330_t